MVLPLPAVPYNSSMGFYSTPFGQNWITRQVTKRLSKDLHTKIE
ncbi:MAG: hypothetical protein WDO16_23090 [Bacteroidota bacterium]